MRGKKGKLLKFKNKENSFKRNTIDKSLARVVRKSEATKCLW